jgi:hypothetical protein
VASAMPATQRNRVMKPVDDAISPADQAMLRKQARENLKRTIDIWLARTAAGGSTSVSPAKMLRSKSADQSEPATVA